MLLALNEQSKHMAEGARGDPKDCKFLALALACKAGILVSSDDDLLNIESWHDTQIVSPASLLSRAAN